MGKQPENLEKTLVFLSQRLADLNYAVRGTASLIRQNVDMNVDDIDIIGDAAMAMACNELLKEYTLKPVAYSETSKYKSYFGQFKINGILVEVYGEWEIKNPQGTWEKIDVERHLVDNVYVTSINSELSMYAAMGRWSAFHKIKKQLNTSESQAKLF